MQSILKRKFFLIPIFSLAFASAGRADNNPDPCGLQARELAAAKYNTPEHDEWEKAWKECTATANQQKTESYAATGDTWAASLAKLPNGGWTLLMVSPDGTYAVFGSHRHATRDGNVVALWLRHEYREEQTTSAGERFRSSVVRSMFDCARVASKGVSYTYYSRNNLDAVGPSYTYDETKVAWSPAIPGTMGDSLLDWACKTTTRPPAKPQ